MSKDSKDHRTKAELLAQIEQLRIRLEEAEQTLEAIRTGAVDALVVTGPQGEQVFTLSGAEHVYRIIVETMNEAALTVDPDGTILFCNQRFCDLINVPMDQVVGRKAAAFAAQPQQAPLATLLADAWTGPVQRRLTLQAADGTAVPVQLAASQLRADDTPSLCLVATDLTELETAAHSIRVLREHEQALQESEFRYRQLVQNANSAIIRWSRDGVVTFFNEYAQAFFGYAEAEAVGRHVNFLVPETESNGTDLTDLAHDIVRNPERYVNNVNENVCRDGRRVWMAWTNRPIFDASGQVAEILAVGTDVTERQQAQAAMQEANHRLQQQAEALQAQEEELRASNEELRAQTDLLRASEQALREAEHEKSLILDNANEIIAYHDVNHNLIWANRAYEQSTRTPLSAMKGKACYHCWGLDRLCHDCPVTLALQTGEPQAAELTPENQPYWSADQGAWHVRAAPVRDHNGDIIGAIEVAYDITERKRAEEALRQLSQFPEENPNPVLRVAADGTLLYANVPAQVWLATLGRQADGPLPAPVRALAAEARGQDQAIEREVESPAGPWFWFSAVRPPGADYVNLYGRDITERKQVEGDLRRERALLDSIMRTTDVMLVLLDPEFNFLWVNPAYAKTCRRKPEEMVGKNHFALYPDAENEAMFRQVRDSGEGVFYKDKPFVFPDQPERGVTYWDWSLTPAKDAAGAVTGLVFSLRETTKSKQAEQALRASEERYHRLFEDDLTGNYLCTSDGRILLCNPAFAAMFGFASAQAAVGTSILELYGAAEQRQALLEKLRQQERIERLEIWWKRRNGEPIYVVENVVGHFDERGELYEIKGYLFDDTERKRAEEALHELNATLENRVIQRTAQLEYRARQLQKLTLELSQTEDRERRQLAEILHDDLQQQLAAAKFHLSLLGSRAKHDPSQRAMVDEVQHIITEAIQKSRDLSHELSPAVLYHEDLGGALRWLADQVRTKHGLAVTVDALGQVNVESDALKGFLFRTARELLFNAVKHARVNEARVRTRRFGRWICLSVSDRGRGFDPQEVQQTAGFGLLSIRERVELLGGRMKIHSRIGQGSAFHVVVPDRSPAQNGYAGTIAVAPRTRPTAEAGPGEGEGGGQEGPPVRVLVVDDHEIVREGLIALLSEADDIEIVGEAANGREAVDQAYRLRPDVVIMDVAMPLINGDDATRQIKRHLPQTRVIGLSMHEEPDMVERMRSAGAEHYLLKTGPSERLLAAIRGRPAPPPAAP